MIVCDTIRGLSTLFSPSARPRELHFIDWISIKTIKIGSLIIEQWKIVKFQWNALNRSVADGPMSRQQGCFHLSCTRSLNTLTIFSTWYVIKSTSTTFGMPRGAHQLFAHSKNLAESLVHWTINNKNKRSNEQTNKQTNYPRFVSIFMDSAFGLFFFFFFQKRKNPKNKKDDHSFCWDRHSAEYQRWIFLIIWNIFHYQWIYFNFARATHSTEI